MKRKLPLLATILVGLVVLVGLVWGGMMLFSKSTTNYAEGGEAVGGGACEGGGSEEM